MYTGITTGTDQTSVAQNIAGNYSIRINLTFFPFTKQSQQVININIFA